MSSLCVVVSDVYIAHKRRLCQTEILNLPHLTGAAWRAQAPETMLWFFEPELHCTTVHSLAANSIDSYLDYSHMGSVGH